MTEIAHYLRTVARAKARSQARQWAEAATIWEAVVLTNPVHGDHWDRLAEARFELGDYNRAAEAYRMVIRLGSSIGRETSRPGEANYRFARCLAQIGEHEGALDALGEAMKGRLRSVERLPQDPYLAPLHRLPKFAEIVGIPDITGLSKAEGWRADLGLLAREAKRRSPRRMDRDTEQHFDKSIEELGHVVHSLTDGQILVRLWQIMRLLGDGHARILVPERHDELGKLLPVQFYLFEEGLYITATEPSAEALLGAEVTAFDGHSTADVIAGVEPLITRDNEFGPKELLPLWLRTTSILHAVGLADDPGKVTITALTDAGQRQVILTATPPGCVALEGFPAPAGWRYLPETVDKPLPHYLRNAGSCFWFDYLAEHQLVYLQFNGVLDDPDESLRSFTDRVFRFIAENPVDRLVVDMRWNRGGNMFLAMPLLHRLIACDKVNQPGGLFLIVGRKTFSAGQIATALIERHTSAIVVGEPTGSRPNFTGESTPFLLPYTGFKVNVSDLHWQNSHALDNRTAVTPEIYLPPTFAAFRENKDPVLDSILEFGDHLPGR